MSRLKMNRFIIASLIPVLLVTSCSRQEPVSHEENIPLEGISISIVISETENTAAEKTIITTVTSETERSTSMDEYDFSVFGNVEITGADLSSLGNDELAVLYVQARYCQAMTDADIDTMRQIVSEDMVFTHMSGLRQIREEYFADIADGSLDYHTIGIEDPVVVVNGGSAEITFTSVLYANAYGATGTYRMNGTHHYELRDGNWIAVNGTR